MSRYRLAVGGRSARDRLSADCRRPASSSGSRCCAISSCRSARRITLRAVPRPYRAGGALRGARRLGEPRTICAPTSRRRRCCSAPRGSARSSASCCPTSAPGCSPPSFSASSPASIRCRSRCFFQAPACDTLPIDMLAYMEIVFDPSVAALSTLARAAVARASCFVGRAVPRVHALCLTPPFSRSRS